MNKQTVRNSIITTLSNNWISSVTTKLFGSGIPIFMLHRTYPDNTRNKTSTPAYLHSCLKYLKNRGYHFVSVRKIVQSVIENTELPKKSIAFTIDDGFYDQGELAAPVFMEFGCPVTIFLISDFIDGNIWPWFSKIEYLIKKTNVDSIHLNTEHIKISCTLKTKNERRSASRTLLESVKKIDWRFLEETLTSLSNLTQVDIPQEPPEEYKPLSWSDIRLLEENGVEFGPHTLSHPILSRVSEEQATKEIIQSWQRLKQELKNPVPVFCYPNGDASDFSEREIEILKKTDMLGALTTIPAQFQPGHRRTNYNWRLPRYSLPNNFYNFIMYSSWIELAKEKLFNRYEMS